MWSREANAALFRQALNPLLHTRPWPRRWARICAVERWAWDGTKTFRTGGEDSPAVPKTRSNATGPDSTGHDFNRTLAGQCTHCQGRVATLISYPLQSGGPVASRRPARRSSLRRRSAVATKLIHQFTDSFRQRIVDNGTFLSRSEDRHADRLMLICTEPTARHAIQWQEERSSW